MQLLVRVLVAGELRLSRTAKKRIRLHLKAVQHCQLLVRVCLYQAWQKVVLVLMKQAVQH